MTEVAPADRLNFQLRFSKEFIPQLYKRLRRGYAFEDLKADTIASATVAVVGLPLSMALAVASGAPPIAGLLCAVIGGGVVSVLGGSSFQIGGPAAAFVSLISATIERHGLQGLFAATILSGLMLLLLGYMRVGSYVKYIPHAVPIGFSAGVAVNLLASQLKGLLGVDLPHEPASLVPKLAAIWSSLGAMRNWTALLSAGSLAYLIYQRQRRPRFPSMLATIVFGTFASAAFDLPVDTVGSKFGSFPGLAPDAFLPHLAFADAFDVVPTAIVIAILCAIESLLSAVIADGMTGSRHNSNCELVAQGYANILTGMFGGICCAGALTRTATNIRAGARSPIAGVLSALLLGGVVLLAAPIAFHIPLATLSAVLVLVGWDMIDRAAILMILRSDRYEAIVLVTTFLITALRDATEGIAVGVSFGSLIFMHRMAKFVEEQVNENLSGAHDEVDEDGNHHINGLCDHDGALVYRIRGPLFLGLVPQFLTFWKR
ncbi:SulP family inorganic anion transporter [Methylocystis sp. IM2]|uniref:SulP family inorganic anion transporter n=1 Tax=unclassified Methylocystis TaxID=2625913 RepID=UPI0030F88326